MGSSVWALQQRQGVPQITKAFSSFQETTDNNAQYITKLQGQKKEKKKTYNSADTQNWTR